MSEYLIPLTQGQVSQLDSEDHLRFSKYRYHAQWDSGTQSFYARRWVWLPNRKQRAILLHREIVGLEYGDSRQVDHLNHDTLDNRRENLRIVSNRENNENRRDQSAHGVGVRWRTDLSRFEVMVRWEGRQANLGLYKTAAEARAAREIGLRLQEESGFDIHTKEDRAELRAAIRTALKQAKGWWRDHRS